jgi:hypothetical protein
VRWSSSWGVRDIWFRIAVVAYSIVSHISESRCGAPAYSLFPISVEVLRAALRVSPLRRT